MTNPAKIENKFADLLKLGAHLGYNKSRRHPSTSPYILGTKNRLDLINLEKTLMDLEKAKAFMKKLGEGGKIILLIGTKPEARKIIQEAAESINMPFVVERWVGGSITNFPEIRKRVDRMVDLRSKKEKGELDKYTKKERLLIDREIAKLDKSFAGLLTLKKIPDAVLIIDPKHEDNALLEAIKYKLPVIALASTDTDISRLNYPIVANDAATTSIKFFVDEIANAYKQ